MLVALYLDYLWTTVLEDCCDERRGQIFGWPLWLGDSLGV
jgi:hypothetical protein